MAFGLKARTNVKEFLSRQCFIDDEERGFVNRVVVHQLSAQGKRGMEVGSVDLTPKPAAGELKAFVDEVDSITSADADGAGVLQKYVLVAMHKQADGSHVPGAKLTVTVQPESDPDEGEMMSEGPTKSGFLAQMMRHNEVYMRTAIGGAEMSMKALRLELDKAHALNDKLLDKQMEMVELIEQLHSKKHERDLATQESSAKIVNKQELVNKLMLVAPILVNKLLSAKDGKKIIGENTTAIEQIVHSIMVTIKPTQIDKLLDTLEPDQRMAFMELYQAVAKFDPGQKQIGVGGEAANGGQGGR